MRLLDHKSEILITVLLSAAVICMTACGGSSGETVDINGDWYRSPAIEAKPGDYDPDELCLVVKDGKAGFINSSGDEVIPCRYSYEVVFDESGYASASLDGKSGVINTSGEEVIPFEYDWINDTSADSDYVGAIKDGKSGFINLSGGEGIPFCFDEVDYFSAEGYAGVSLKNKWGVINTSGEIIVPIMYDEINLAYKGYTVVTKGSKKGLTDPSGKEVMPVKYDMIDVIPAGDTVVLAVYDKNKSYLYSAEGKVVAEFGDAALGYDTELKSGGIIAASSESVKSANSGEIDVDNLPVYTLYDKQGRPITDANYNCHTDYGNVITVQTEESSGLMSVSGDEILPCEYNVSTEIYRKDRSPWLAFYKLYEGWTVYDTDGNRQDTLKKAIEGVPDDSDFELIGDDRIVIGMVDGFDGPLAGDMKDLSGRRINPENIKVIYGSDIGNTVVIRNNENEKYGLMDTDGNILAECRYSFIDTAGYSSGKFFMAKINDEDSKVTYFNSKGRQITGEEEYDDPYLDGIIGTD